MTASYTASDALAGLADGSPAGGTHTFTAEVAGQSHTFTVTDKAGNTASATVSDVNIDKTAPSATATVAPPANVHGWHNTNVTVTFSGTDALSGIDTCDAPTVLSNEAANQSASGSCTDKAGNTASATASGIDIDKTAPTISASRCRRPTRPSGGRATSAPARPMRRRRRSRSSPQAWCRSSCGPGASSTSTGAPRASARGLPHLGQARGRDAALGGHLPDEIAAIDPWPA